MEGEKPGLVYGGKVVVGLTLAGSLFKKFSHAGKARSMLTSSCPRLITRVNTYMRLLFLAKQPF